MSSDAYGLVRNYLGFFLEFERRAIRPTTMVSKFRPYIRYYRSEQYTRDYGRRPCVLFVMPNEEVASRFLVVARKECARQGVTVPFAVTDEASIRAPRALEREI